MTEVRRHQRQTASGKTATVRQHERNTGAGQAWADRVQETTQRGWAIPSRAEHAEPPRDGEWWDDDEATPAGDWWAEEEEPVSEDSRSPEERYEAARRALNENALRDYAAGTGDETPEFLQLNHEVAEAGQGVSGWQRSRIDNRVADEQDYDAQMRQIRRQRREAERQARTRTGKAQPLGKDDGR